MVSFMLDYLTRRVGKGFAINQIIKATFFYPLEPDGRRGEVTTVRRPLKEGESMEWVLLDGVSDVRVSTDQPRHQQRAVISGCRTSTLARLT